jgi:hypothetical protein
MNIFLTQHLRRRLFAAVLICAFQPGATAEPIPVRHIEETIHGFLALRTKEGRVLAVGDLFQVVRGDRLTTRLLFGFKDGAVGDETAVFSQRGNSRLTFVVNRLRSVPRKKMGRKTLRTITSICRRTCTTA